MEVKFDESMWPIVQLEYPKSCTDEEWQAHCDRCNGYTNRGECFALISDTRQTQPPSAKQSKLLAAAHAAGSDALRRLLVGTAIITTSPLIRGVMTAVGWFTPTPFPVRYFRRPNEGVAWARQQLSAAANRAEKLSI